VDVDLTTLSLLNFESPADVNGDNIYEFTLEVRYNGEVIPVAVTVTVTDIVDGAETTASVIASLAGDRRFGDVLRLLPDVSGDGDPDLAASVSSGGGEALGFNFASGELANIATSPIDTADPSTYGLPLETDDPAEAWTWNRVMVRAEPAGGTDLLIADAEAARLRKATLATPAP